MSIHQYPNNSRVLVRCGMLILLLLSNNLPSSNVKIASTFPVLDQSEDRYSVE